MGEIAICLQDRGTGIDADAQAIARRLEAHARIPVAHDNRDAAPSLATLLALDEDEIRVANDGDRATGETKPLDLDALTAYRADTLPGRPRP